MRMLWALGEGTVHQVRARLLPDRPLAYTTVLTVMDQLARKGLVSRQRRGRPYVYRPVVSEHEVRERALDRLARNFFVSSRDSLRRYLAGGAVGREPVRSPDADPLRQGPKPSSEIDPSLL